MKETEVQTWIGLIHMYIQVGTKLMFMLFVDNTYYKDVLLLEK